MQTINQTRLIRSIQTSAEKLIKPKRTGILTELLNIRTAYENAENGYTFELALHDLWERMNETPERKAP